MGSWLEGPQLAADGWPGQRLGLPDEGPGSVAPVSKRLVSVCIDWALSMLIAFAFLHGNSWGTLGIFLVENLVLQSTLGFTVGQRIMGVRLIGPGGIRPGFGWVLLRVVLLGVVIPAVIYNADRRGLHDLAANTTVVRF